jgi:hypothetical protein
VVVVLVEGRPRVLHGAADNADAVLHAFLPGPEGGVGIAEILFGRVNPSARMPLSYPKAVSVASCPALLRERERGPGGAHTGGGNALAFKQPT